LYTSPDVPEKTYPIDDNTEEKVNEQKFEDEAKQRGVKCLECAAFLNNPNQTSVEHAAIFTHLCPQFDKCGGRRKLADVLPTRQEIIQQKKMYSRPRTIPCL